MSAVELYYGEDVPLLSYADELTMPLLNDSASAVDELEPSLLDDRPFGTRDLEFTIEDMLRGASMRHSVSEDSAIGTSSPSHQVCRSKSLRCSINIKKQCWIIL